VKQLTAIERHDRDAVRAYQRASTGGHVPAVGSPIAKAALRAIQRQELAHPEFDFVKACLEPVQPGDDIREHAAETVRGRQVARSEPPKQPVPDTPSIARLRASLAGQGNIDLSGGASTIATDLDRWKDAERGRQVMNDPCFEEAMSNASIRAAKAGRKATAADFNTALAEARAKRGPTPYVPPQPVTPLLRPTAAKATTSPSFSPLPDRFRR
jgi:hypothetical protein